MFYACQNKGFQMTFANGWTVSVQWGPGNYCDCFSTSIDAPMKATNEIWKSETAEIAAWHNRSEEWVNFGSDTVKGHLTADEVMIVLQTISTRGPDASVKLVSQLVQRRLRKAEQSAG
jgi:hypothetical protein